MKPIRLESPFPKNQETNYEEFAYPIVDIKYLPVPSKLPIKTFLNVLDRRRSSRDFETLSTHRLSELLWHSARTRGSFREESGFLWQHRAAPSGGGRHPIDIMVSEFKHSSRGLYLYNPISHSLSCLSIENGLFQSFVSHIKEVLPIGRSTIIWFVAQVGRTSSKYENAESLVWRDAGCLLATIYLVAEYLDLNCCGVGASGDPWISRSINANNNMFGVGGCLIGENPKEIK